MEPTEPPGRGSAPDIATEADHDHDPGRRREPRLAVVVAGGAPIPAPTVDDLPGDALVIAADSGLDRANDLGWQVHAVVGDLDSARQGALDDARARNIEIRRHPSAKDETDLELALQLAVERSASRIVVVGVDGDRIDHVLANAFLLASPAFAAVEVEGRFGSSVVRIVRRAVDIVGAPGQIVSLLPAHGPAHGVVTDGLCYPLRDETLPAGSPRGMSNVLAGDRASVSLREGTLLVITAAPTDHAEDPPAASPSGADPNPPIQGER